MTCTTLKKGGKKAKLSTDPVIEDLANYIQSNPAFAARLQKSISIAPVTAYNDLDRDLYNALLWPTTTDGYLSYLTWFSTWAPQQSDLPAWRNANSNSQEVYDRLCHFCYLIDQPEGDEAVQNDEFFSNWLVGFANDWGSFLNSPASWSEEQLQSFIHFSPQYRVQDSMVNGKPNQPWNSFNDFFSRILNPGLRPITLPNSNLTPVSPADCTFRAKYAITDDNTIPQIRLKFTHSVANISELLSGSPYATAFAGGTFVHYFLSPYSYHRFHSSVSGLVKECRAVQGLAYLDVNLKNNQFDAPDNSEDGYEFTQARGIFTVDTTDSPDGNIGIVAVLPIGMCQVSGVTMKSDLVGQSVEKGTEFGNFFFGGSDIIVLFQKGFDGSSLSTDSSIYRHYGTSMLSTEN